MQISLIMRLDHTSTVSVIHVCGLISPAASRSIPDHAKFEASFISIMSVINYSVMWSLVVRLRFTVANTLHAEERYRARYVGGGWKKREGIYP